jgi:hypothetical protein
VDASVVGGCEDTAFAGFSLLLWKKFIQGEFVMVLSEHTLRELQGAPQQVRGRLFEIPKENVKFVPDTPESDSLAQAYLDHGVVGPGSRSDALHVALATVSRVDVLVSWNFRHVVNLNRIRLFNAVNMERGYGLMEIRSPREVLSDAE